jgi:hypothetical protein
MAEQFDFIYWRGQGPLMLSPRDASGNPTGFVFVGDVESVEGQPNISRRNIKENVSGQRNTAASFITEQETAITINLKSAKPEHLAEVLQADLTAKAAASVTDEVVTAALDKLVQLAHVKVSSVVVTDSTGSTTYTEGSTGDYILHADEGFIEPLSSGSITEGQTLHVDYDYQAQKHLAANPANTELYASFQGINTTNGDKRGRCEIYKLQIDPGFLGLIQQDQEAVMSVNAVMLVDSSRPIGDRLYGWKFED